MRPVTRVRSTIVLTAFVPSACSGSNAAAPRRPADGGALAVALAGALARSSCSPPSTMAALPGNGLPVTIADTGTVVGATRRTLRSVHFAAGRPPLIVSRTQPDFRTPLSIRTPYTSLAWAIVERAAGEWSVRVWPPPPARGRRRPAPSRGLFRKKRCARWWCPRDVCPWSCGTPPRALNEWNDGIFRGAWGDMSGSLTGGKAGGVEQLPGGLLGNTAPVGTSSTVLLRKSMTRVPHNGGIGGVV